MSIATVGIAVPISSSPDCSSFCFVFIWLIFAGGWGTLKQVALPAFCLGCNLRSGNRAARAHWYADDAAPGLHSHRLCEGLKTHRRAGARIERAMLPVVSFLGPAVAGILTGSVIIEYIFAIPGLGYQFVQSATQRDFTVAMGLVMVYTSLLYTMNTLVDIAYTVLDPRVKLN